MLYAAMRGSEFGAMPAEAEREMDRSYDLIARKTPETLAAPAISYVGVKS
jgi:hypothetical protein